MKWFKHDTDASIDAKLQELLLDYGASGYGLYWYCVELIAQNVDEKNITFELEHDARIIARNLNLTVQETKDMMSKMIDLELFSISKNEKLACYTLAKRLDQSMTSSKGFREVISKIKEQSHDRVMINHDIVMQEESREEENRVEQNRKEKKKEVIVIPAWLNINAWNEWIAYRKEIKKKLTPSMIDKQIEFLGRYEFDHEEIIHQSIKNGWTGLFSLKTKVGKSQIYTPVNGMTASQLIDAQIEHEQRINDELKNIIG